MTNAETAAFNSGVLTVLGLARSTAASMEARMVLKPTRYNFAVEALLALALEGRSLLKGGDETSGVAMPAQPPRRPVGDNGVELVVPAHVGDDGNFGLTDDEIMRPSRETIVNWLKAGRRCSLRAGPESLRICCAKMLPLRWSQPNE